MATLEYWQAVNQQALADGRHDDEQVTMLATDDEEADYYRLYDYLEAIGWHEATIRKWRSESGAGASVLPDGKDEFRYHRVIL